MYDVIFTENLVYHAPCPYGSLSTTSAHALPLRHKGDSCALAGEGTPDEQGES